MSDSCQLCGADGARIESHHISYEPEEVIDVCSQCHSDIHKTDKYPELAPDDADLREFYDSTNAVDKSEIPSRPGYSIQIKTIPCNKGHCTQCPHGPYYYYYKRNGDDVICEYGGKVTPEMFTQQTSIGDYANRGGA